MYFLCLPHFKSAFILSHIRSWWLLYLIAVIHLTELKLEAFYLYRLKNPLSPTVSVTWHLFVYECSNMYENLEEKKAASKTGILWQIEQMRHTIKAKLGKSWQESSHLILGQGSIMTVKRCWGESGLWKPVSWKLTGCLGPHSLISLKHSGRN